MSACKLLLCISSASLALLVIASSSIVLLKRIAMRQLLWKAVKRPFSYAGITSREIEFHERLNSLGSSKVANLMLGKPGKKELRFCSFGNEDFRGKTVLFAIVLFFLLLAFSGLYAAILFLLFLRLLYLPISSFIERKRRKSFSESLEQALPHCLEMMSVLIDSGKNIPSALARLSSMDNALSSYFQKCCNMMSAGVPMSKCFSSIGSDSGCECFTDALTMICDSEKLGVPLTTPLIERSRNLREERRLKCRASAAKAPVLMLFPLVFFILPSFILVTIGSSLVGNLF